ncbi:MAG TPA: glycosyltransferase 87 family protein [Chloroflexota bacterium]|nr:glycosyltransferase 87 family protein [Chloroflexota bacterium]
MVSETAALRPTPATTASITGQRLSQLGFGLIVFSLMIDWSLLHAWSIANKGFYASDWLTSYQAAERVRAGSTPYGQAGAFLSAPTFLLLVRSMLFLGYPASRWLWSMASAVMLVGAGGLTVASLVPRPTGVPFIRGAILILAFTPTILLIPTSANTTAEVVLGYALALWCFTRNYEARGGAALALTVLIKPHLAILIFPLLVYKRRWRAARAYAGSVAAAGLLALAVLGPGAFGGFFRILNSTESGANSLSLWVKDIPGLHAMFLQIWPGSALASGVAYGLSGLLLLGLAWYWRGPWLSGQPQFLAGWAMLPLVDLLVVPYAHTDDLVLLIIPAIVLCGFLANPITRPGMRRWILPILLALYLSPTLVAYFRLHFVAPAMLAALVVLWWLAPPVQPGSPPAYARSGSSV